MKAIFCGAKILKIGDSDPFGRIVVVTAKPGVSTVSGVSQKSGKTYDIRSVFGVEELPFDLELFPGLAKLDAGQLIEVELSPDPSNLRRSMVSSFKAA
mgnify:CR=1 FL=1